MHVARLKLAIINRKHGKSKQKNMCCLALGIKQLFALNTKRNVLSVLRIRIADFVLFEPLDPDCDL